MAKQQTIADTIEYEGIGLHSGRPVRMTIKPAKDNDGIVFVRTDLPGKPRIRAHITNVAETNRATTLTDGKAKVHTGEHLLAALAGLRISNALVELDAEEPPVGDGSAQTFVDLITKTGILSGQAEETVYEVQEPIFNRFGDRYMIALPSPEFRISLLFTNKHPMIGVQYEDFVIDGQTFVKEVASARTIGFMHEVEELKRQGLGLGGNLDNAIVFDDKVCLSVLRFSDEPVRHKILDVIGDLALIGPIRAHIVAVKSSHALNTDLARKIYSAIQGCKEEKVKC